MSVDQENKKWLDKYYKELRNAEYVGEDGDMAVNCKTVLGALRKFRARVAEDVGWDESTELNEANIGRGWLHLATDEDRENYGDDAEWYISYKKDAKNDYPVWIYMV